MIDGTVITEPWTDLLCRWDRQQDALIEPRERRYATMLEFLAALRPEPDLFILDLASGPGTVSDRFLRRFPRGRAVAVDVDPVLLRIGEGALGDHGGRLRWAQVDLRSPGWAEGLGAELVGPGFDAVVSANSLHWLSPPDLVGVYRQAASLLRPGGVLLNGDHLPLPRRTPRLRAAARTLHDRHVTRSLDAGAEPWHAWWQTVEERPDLAATIAQRDAFWPDRGEHDWPAPTLEFHLSALMEAGFAEVGTVWQDFQEWVLAAVR